jgi:beta-glucosidase
MKNWNDPCTPLDQRVDALLAELTLEEKVGQLGSYWPAPRTTSLTSGDVAPMQSAMGAGSSWEESTAYGLGHLTRPFGTEPVSPGDGVRQLREYQRAITDRSRLAIPAIAHEECLTGFTSLGATVYPAPIAWGATFNPDLVRDMAQAIGEDMRTLGVHQGLSPLMDVVRDYRWGRVEETIGEDPYLVGTLGTAYVRGLQGAGIVATLKHFAGYSASRAGRNHAPVSMGQRELEDVILPPFEMAVREGKVGSVMNSYSDIDGVPAGASVDLLTGILRDRWGFEGTVVSDYWSVAFLESMHRVASTAMHAGALALRAGIDVELPNTNGFVHLVQAISEGLADEAEVDRAARRVLRQKIELGLLDDGRDVTADGADVDLDSPRNRGLARQVAEESVSLLANRGALPLTHGASIALIGPCAADARTVLGCYSYPNHVMLRYPDLGLGLDVTNLVDALKAELGENRVTHQRGVPILEPDRSGLSAAVEAARAADVAVVTVGDLAGLFGHGTSGEGCDVVDLTLPGLQGELVEAILDTGTPTVLVVISGRPYSLGEFAPHCAAILQAFMPGVEGGHAISGVLTGRVNPSGKLPVAIPARAGGQPGTYLTPPLGWHSSGISNLDPRPAFPFGHGISYTTFRLDDLQISAAEVPVDGAVEISAIVSNTGTRDGAEVIQLYLGDPVAEVARPMKQLTAYAKVHLKARQSRRVTFQVHADRTSFVGVDLERIVEPGEVQVMVGSSSEDLPLKGTYTLVGRRRVVGEGRVLCTPVRVEEV